MLKAGAHVTLGLPSLVPDFDDGSWRAATVLTCVDREPYAVNTIFTEPFLAVRSTKPLRLRAFCTA
jgi:hypothetical protein